MKNIRTLFLILTSVLLFSSCSYSEEVLEKKDVAKDVAKDISFSKDKQQEKKNNNNFEEKDLKKENHACAELSGGEKDACLSNFYTNEAIMKKDLSLCENILVKKDKVSCKDNILSIEASEKKDTKICDGISTEELKVSCKDNIQMMETINENNPEYCEKIQDEVKRESCKANFATKDAIEQGSVEGCSALEGTAKDKCESETLINLAISKMDKTQCSKIKIEEDKETCNQILKSILGE